MLRARARRHIGSCNHAPPCAGTIGRGAVSDRRRAALEGTSRGPRSARGTTRWRAARPAAIIDPTAPASSMLISCVAYQNGRKLADLPVEDVSEYVGRPDCFVWVALFQPTREELDQMAEEFGLHELAVEDARKGHQRPKIEEYGDSLFAVLHPVEMEKAEDGTESLVLGEVDIFVGPNYILSVRHRTKLGFAAVRTRTEREPDLLRHGAGFVFYALIDNVVDRYFPVLDDLETRLEAAEEHMFAAPASRRQIEQLYALKGMLMTLKHAVTPLMEAVGKLYGGRVPQLCQGTQDYFRDVYDHLARINAAIESSREMLTTAIQVNLALIGISDNEVTKRLAAYGALITVPTLVAGIYGMNFHHMPELDWSFGYPLAIAVMLVIDGLLFLRFRKVKWI
jgi:magnesium transporter